MKVFGNEWGQSLVEVLIAIMVVTMVLTALMATVIVAVRSAQFSKQKTKGAFLAQEGVEWVRSQRQEFGFGALSNLDLPAPGSTTYCLIDLSSDFDTFLPGNCLASDYIDGVYGRELTVTYDQANLTVTAEVVTNWTLGNKDYSSPVRAEFSQWEKTSRNAISNPQGGTDCFVQGRKVLVPYARESQNPDQDEQQLLNSQTVSVDLNPEAPHSKSPYGFGGLTSNTSYLVTITEPAGYSAGYTLCYNSISCHSQAPTSGNSVNISIPLNPDPQPGVNCFADLYWHFTAN